MKFINPDQINKKSSFTANQLDFLYQSTESHYKCCFNSPTVSFVQFFIRGQLSQIFVFCVYLWNVERCRQNRRNKVCSSHNKKGINNIFPMKHPSLSTVRKQKMNNFDASVSKKIVYLFDWFRAALSLCLWF